MSPDALARKAVKAAALPLGWHRGRRPGDTVILLYHRIGGDRTEIELSPTAFERQLRFLSSRERVRSIDDVVGNDGGGVVISFDDGTRDFYEEVLPLLSTYRFPVVLYLATRMAEARTGVTWEQLREAVSTGLVTVGSHTHSHADLSRASESEADQEMRRSRDLIEDRLGAPCRHFAYPWGVASPGARRAAERLFLSAALDTWVTNRRGRTDPLRLGRVPILRADGQFFFVRKVRGQLDGERFAYRLLRRGPWRSP